MTPDVVAVVAAVAGGLSTVLGGLFSSIFRKSLHRDNTRHVHIEIRVGDKSYAVDSTHAAEIRNLLDSLAENSSADVPNEHKK